MAVVNKFNVNREQVRLDADIIENMSANNVSYNNYIQYDENTVGDKLSELEQKVTDTYKKVSGLNSDFVSDVDESIEIYEGDTLIAKIDKESADFKNLKNNGHNVQEELITGDNITIENNAISANIKSECNVFSQKVGSSVAMISFLYDGEYEEDMNFLLPLFEERGLVATFAVHGGSRKLKSHRYQELLNKGFGTMVYGGYVEDDGKYNKVNAGVKLSNYYDLVDNAIRSKTWFIDNGLQCNGFVEYMGGGGGIRDQHFQSLYYQYVIKYDNDGDNDLTKRDVFNLGRYITDNANYFKIYDGIDSAIESGKWVSLGGHMTLTGSGADGRSTTEQFVALLDYIKKLIDSGKLVCVSTDVAFFESVRRLKNVGGSLIQKYNDKIVSGAILKSDNKVRFYTSKTTFAKFQVVVSGSFNEGDIITIKEDIGMDGIINTITHTLSTSVDTQGLIDILLNGIIFRQYVSEIDYNNRLIFTKYAETKNGSTFEISTNSTTGSISVTTINEQVNAEFIELSK